jgi:tetratricopeptide (TPR) repeat protein
MNEDDKRGYYRSLGSNPNSSPAELRQNYRRLAFRHHPDREPDPDLRLSQQSTLRTLNEAYEALRDPERRSDYDAECGFARCARHPETFLTLHCQRCGDGMCPLCASAADGLCGTCRERASRRMRTSDPVERALLAIEDGELDLANTELRSVLLANPRDVVALTALSMVREKQGDQRGAVVLLKLAVQIKPGHSLSHYRLGRLHQTLGDSRNARDSFEEALRLSPGNSKYRGALASLNDAPDFGVTSPYRLHDRVKHQVFGSGVVTEVTPVGVKVAFPEAGTRWLDPVRAPMVRHL